MPEILKYLKGKGERLDSEIASDTGIALSKVRLLVADLSARGEVIVCQAIRYDNGKKVEGMLCRVAGYIPPASPGRKAKAQVVAS